MKIEIETESDYYDCDQAGCSGGYEEGGTVTIDGEIVFQHKPNAGCFDNEGFSWAELLLIGLKKKGIEVTAYGDYTSLQPLQPHVLKELGYLEDDDVH